MISLFKKYGTPLSLILKGKFGLLIKYDEHEKLRELKIDLSFQFSFRVKKSLVGCESKGRK
jgi:hypothetical protein